LGSLFYKEALEARRRREALRTFGEKEGKERRRQRGQEGFKGERQGKRPRTPTLAIGKKEARITFYLRESVGENHLLKAVKPDKSK